MSEKTAHPKPSVKTDLKSEDDINVLYRNWHEIRTLSRIACEAMGDIELHNQPYSCKQAVMICIDKIVELIEENEALCSEWWPDE